MGSTSLTLNIPLSEASVSAGKGETASSGEMRRLGTTRRTVVEAEPRVCQHCHYELGNARPSNTSPLAGIDVFGLPAESDVKCTHDRFH